tara:strand:+ start:112 stop:420 length:309 start_codon:yes stop_codon:yes gene_type:complete
MNDVATEIMRQIKEIDPWALDAWGAAYQPKIKITKDGEVVGVRLKSSGMCTWKGFIEVIYNYGADSYTVTFFKMRKHKKFVKEVASDIYADMLVSTIDGVVQ